MMIAKERTVQKMSKWLAAVVAVEVVVAVTVAAHHHAVGMTHAAAEVRAKAR